MQTASGVLIKGLKEWIPRVLQQYPALRLRIREHKFDFELLFGAMELSSDSPDLIITYRSLKHKAMGFELDISNSCDDSETQWLNDIAKLAVA